MTARQQTRPSDGFQAGLEQAQDALQRPARKTSATRKYLMLDVKPAQRRTHELELNTAGKVGNNQFSRAYKMSGLFDPTQLAIALVGETPAKEACA
jgi:hypothetical protein